MIHTATSVKALGLLWLLLYVGTFKLLAAASVGIQPAPAWVIPVSPGGKAPSSKDFSDGYYVAFIDRQVNLDRQTTYQRFIRQIASESGVQNGSEISVVFDPTYERVDFHAIIIWRDGKAISHLKASDFKVLPLETDRQRFLYNGYHSASVILKDVRKGDRIEYMYSTTGWNSVFQNKYSENFTFSAYDYIPHIHYAILAPQDRKLHFKDFNRPPAKSVRPAGPTTIYEWDLKNIKSTPYEDYTPSWATQYPFVQVSEYGSWQEVVDWGLHFYQYAALSGALKAKTEAWKKQANGSRLAYIEQAVHFVQDEIRYLGLETGENSHRPHRPDEVFAQRYGDCKDKALLLCAFLRANDIACDPVLVDTYKKARLQDYLPAPTNFNHVVVRMELAKDRYAFVDGTYSLQGGTANKFYMPPYGAGLLLKKGQTSLIAIPPQNPGYVTVQEEITLPAPTDPAGKGLFSVKTVYFDSEADDIRDTFQQSNISETENNYLNYYRDTYKHADFELLDSLEYYDQREANNFSLVERYQMTNGWQYDSTRQTYVFSILGKMLYDQLVHLPNRPRTAAVALKYPYHMQYTIQVHTPGPWNVPEDQWEIERDAYVIRFKSRWVAEENNWVLSYEYQTRQDHVPVEQVAQLKKDIERLVTNLEYELTPPGSTPVGDPNFGMILFALLALAGGTWLSFWLYKYSPGGGLAVAKSTSLGGWLIVLGIGLVVKPLLVLTPLLSNTSAYFTASGWNYFAGDNSFKILAFRTMLVFEVLFNILLFCISILLIILYFKKRDSFPRIFSITICASLFFLFVTTGISNGFFRTYVEASIQQSQYEIFRQFVYAAVWVPYLYKSSRVKKTFVRPYGHIRTADTSKDPEVMQTLE
ncbi:hypothetical protein GCM10027275_48810 [Rhabdobacter roseus]|uniref:Transglutaminase-like putative cysteine protease n=1 Tax=Rhabdobacter roseus TaxID=1655419 RepID=A0A840TVL4_9BACT|nr:DUF3857 domain-containing protein [Rhabdobacter roseus]MBB5286945.1 transglutaminase-like putative cysteine protease [Rhabdobacter roseus]